MLHWVSSYANEWQCCTLVIIIMYCILLTRIPPIKVFTITFIQEKWNMKSDIYWLVDVDCWVLKWFSHLYVMKTYYVLFEDQTHFIIYVSIEVWSIFIRGSLLPGLRRANLHNSMKTSGYNIKCILGTFLAKK